MYELIILAYLAQRAASGYQILKVANDAVGPFTRISKGRLYPLLGRLERDGLLRQLDTDGGRARVFELTGSGRERLTRLLTDTSASLGNYQRIFAFKAMMIDLLETEQRRLVLDHYRDYCQRHIDHLGAEADQLEQPGEGQPPQAANIARVMRHQIRQWQLELHLVDALQPTDRTAPP
jgi:DNA-binding PadR family transcriptional regulator